MRRSGESDFYGNRATVAWVAAEPVTAETQPKEPLTKLLLTSGLWMQVADSERDETRQQLLDLIDRVVGLL